jgi:hypothetical protein
MGIPTSPVLQNTHQKPWFFIGDLHIFGTGDIKKVAPSDLFGVKNAGDTEDTTKLQFKYYDDKSWALGFWVTKCSGKLEAGCQLCTGNWACLEAIDNVS